MPETERIIIRFPALSIQIKQKSDPRGFYLADKAANRPDTYAFVKKREKRQIIVLDFGLKEFPFKHWEKNQIYLYSGRNNPGQVCLKNI